MSHQPPDPVLRRLARMNRTAVFLAALAVGLAGFFLPGAAGALVLYAVVFGLAWLHARTFTVTPPPLRVVRVIVICVLTIIATSKIV
ncbi:MAG: hypothetical protein K6T92_07590 [Candidatus Rokubacteria bacterium]|nr:hypothetical protein [Candidatus Rokubacteria bacterium]